MKGLLLALCALAGAVSVTAGAGAAPAGSSTAVAVTSSGLGRILVDGAGRTLYLFQKDTHGKSSCTGQCAAYWPPLLASGKPLARAGVKASLLGTIKRADGRLQVTYNHHPLYIFVKDTRGMTSGEGVNTFGATWYVVSPAGARIVQQQSAPSDGYSAPGGYTAPGGYSAPSDYSSY